MPSSSSRVIETAVRTFSDNAELKLAATELLAWTSGNPSEEAIARWDEVDSKKRGGPIRRWLPWGILVVASALMWLADSRDMIAYYQWVKCKRTPYPMAWRHTKLSNAPPPVWMLGANCWYSAT